MVSAALLPPAGAASLPAGPLNPHSEMSVCDRSRRQSAEELKQAGNAAFREGRFTEAVQRFSAAIESLGAEAGATLFSNRSGALAALGRYSEALADADHCLSLDREWAKGYSRKGAALYGLGRYDEALSMYEAGLAADPSSAQIEQAASDVRQKLAGARQLLEAAMTGSLDTVRQCLGSSIHPDGLTTPNGSTPLMAAAEAGHAEIVAELLAARADAARPNSAGDTAASLARRNGHEAVLAALLSAVEVNGGSAAPPSSAKPSSAFSANALFGAAKGLAEKTRLAAEKTRLAAEHAAAQVSQAATQARDDMARAQKERERAAEWARQQADEKAQKEAADAAAYAQAEAVARAEGERVAAATAAAEASAAAAAAVEGSEFAESYKQHGNAAFKEGRYADAVKLYSQAMECAPSSAVLYSNRSGALAASGSYTAALSDAERCVALEPKWAKGHTRKAASLHGLKRYLGAVQAYEEALVYEPGAEALLLGRRQSSFSLAIEPE